MPSGSGGNTGNYYHLLDNDAPKRRVDINNTYDFPEFTKHNKKSKNNNQVSQAKFITIKAVNTEKPLNSYNVFLIEKALESITIEKPEKITFTRDGNLLILTKSHAQTNRFLKATNLSSICPIKVDLHPTLNISKGVMHCSALTNLSEKEIIDGLSSQFVVECKKITKFVEGKQVNTPLHILSFNLHDIPSEISIAWEKCKVNPYIPTPMQCKNCHRIGHTKKHCNSEEKCLVCSGPEHETPCETVKCINCNQHHRSNNKSCQTYIKRQNIIKYKTINKCSYRESVQAINQMSTNLNDSSPVESLNDALAIKSKLKSLLKNKINEIKQTSETQTTPISLPSTSNNSNKKPLIKPTSTILLYSKNKKSETSISPPLSPRTKISKLIASSSDNSKNNETSNNKTDEILKKITGYELPRSSACDMDCL